MDVRGLKMISAVPSRFFSSHPKHDSNLQPFSVGSLKCLHWTGQDLSSGTCVCFLFIFIRQSLHCTFREMARWMSVEMRWICLFVPYKYFLWRGLALISLSSWRIYKCYMQEHAILLCLWSLMNMLHLFGVHFCIIQYLCACVLHESLWDALYLNAPTVIHTHTDTHCHVMLNRVQWTLTGPWLELMKNYINGGCWSLD